MASKAVFAVTAAGLVFLLVLGCACSHSVSPTAQDLGHMNTIIDAAEVMGLASSRQHQDRAFACPATCPSCPACGACPSSPPCPRVIPPGYQYYKGFGYYKVHYVHNPWARARASCEAQGARLLIIDSQKEADFVSELMVQYGIINGQYYHIGFTDSNGNQTYVTLLDDLLTSTGYFTWAPGEPSHPGSARCGAFLPYKGLNDIVCSDEQPFVCELIT